MDTNSTIMSMIGPQHFDVLNYTLFMIMLGLSIVVGVYFGCFGNKQKTQVDFLFGGKEMGTLPVSVSLIFSYISGITMLGVPSEVYFYGTSYAVVMGSVIICIFINHFLFLPTFFKLQLTSVFEYLELRFDRRTRILASFLFILMNLIYVPIVIYVPALTFSQVSGIHLHIITPVVCFVCILYTMLGGIKAVIWTDFLQAFVMLGACVVILFQGIFRIGSLSEVWRIADENKRLNHFNFDPNPFQRSTFWSVLIGATFTTICGTGLNQGMIQKCISLPTLKKAVIALYVFSIGVCCLTLISVLSGLIIYASYRECDPYKAGLITRLDQIYTFFVMDMGRNVTGIPGLFVAGIFSAALSTMSSCLNSLSACIYEDFLKPFFPNISESRITFTLRTIVVIFGIFCILMVYIIEHLGGVLEVNYCLNGTAQGALCGMFLIGLLVPQVNSKGIMAGASSAIMLIGYVVVGAQIRKSSGVLAYPFLEQDISGCPFNVTTPPTVEPLDPENVWPIFRLSYLYYSLAGIMVVFLVSIPVSFLTGAKSAADADPKLFPPFYGNFLKRARAKKQRNRANSNNPQFDFPEKEPLNETVEGKNLSLYYSDKDSDNIYTKKTAENNHQNTLSTFKTKAENDSHE